MFFEQNTNAFTFAAALLETRGKVLSPSLHPIIEDHLRRREPAAAETAERFSDSVRAVIAAASLDHPPCADEVARQLGCSTATMNRRLATEGTNWRALLAVHRMDAAARLLRDSGRDISAIALSLGFSESAAFVRSFTRHFGTPPGRYRRRLNKGAAPVAEGGAKSR